MDTDWSPDRVRITGLAVSGECYVDINRAAPSAAVTAADPHHAKSIRYTSDSLQPKRIVSLPIPQTTLLRRPLARANC